MKILLFGKNGQVGWELQRSLAPVGELIALGTNANDNPQVNGSALQGDFSHPENLRETVRQVRPHVIVNAAAYTAVDKAESEPALARTINATAVGVLAEEAARLNAAMVHYSTDYVFDGSGQRPWVETDATAALNVYGQTKRAGEQLLQQHNPRHLIFRTSWVYSARGSNFAKTMLRLAQERDRLSVINDQFGTPTGAELLADITAHAIRQLLLDDSIAGLYHLTASGETTWYDYACYVLETARQAGIPIKVAPQNIEPVASSAYVTPAKRPHNSRLNTQKLQKVLGLTMPCWKQGVARILAQTLALPS